MPQKNKKTDLCDGLMGISAFILLGTWLVAMISWTVRGEAPLDLFRYALAMHGVCFASYCCKAAYGHKISRGAVAPVNEQILQSVAKLEERLEQLERRLDKNEELISKIHDLTSSVKELSNEVKGQNSNTQKILERLEASQTRHGERIGELEKKGSKKLETIFATVITVIITAVVMYFIGNVGM